jgi:hypothetical protein
MTITEFSNIAESKLSEKIMNSAWCIIVIFISLFIQIKFSNISISQTNWTSLVFVHTICLSLIALSFYGLVVIIKPLKVGYLENQMTKDENFKLIEETYRSLNGKDFQADDNEILFTYKKSFWAYKQRISFFAEDNLIAIYIKNIDSNPKGGFLDFGVKSRLQKKILNIMKEKACR